MVIDVSGMVKVMPYSCAVKIQVHHLMCTKLMELVDRISKIIPQIEGARPGWSSGMQVLCALTNAIQRAKLLLQQCCESSKLYMAIKGSDVVSKFERLRDQLEQSLSEVQTMVPVMLATEISRVIEDLKGATFSLDSLEEEAGKAVCALFQQETYGSESLEDCQIKALQLAASKLDIKSSKALLIEKRSIKKLLHKVGDNDQQKKCVLKYLLQLLNRYGKFLTEDQTENQFPRAEGQSVELDFSVEYEKNNVLTDTFRKPVPPEEFICPLSSRMMYEPVVIDSGQTFDRVWIQRWFDEGHDTCPKTQKKLAHFSVTPNIVMKDLISKWCKEHGFVFLDPIVEPTMSSTWEAYSASISSLGSSMKDICLQMDLCDLSIGSLDTDYGKITDDVNLLSVPVYGDRYHSSEIMDKKVPEYLSGLAAHSWESQCKLVEDAKSYLISSGQAHRYMSSESIVDPLIQFLKDAQEQHDVNALRSGCQLLLAFVRKGRTEKEYLNDHVLAILASLLDSEVGEDAMAIVELLSGHQYCKSKAAASGALMDIVKTLCNTTRDFQEPAIKIICNLSSNSDMHSHMVSMGCIPRLVALIPDSSLMKYCIAIMRNLCQSEVARVSIATTMGCIASVAKLLEDGSHEDQEHAVAVLLSLCSQRIQYCHLVMGEGVIPALASICVNGNEKGKASASELLRILRDVDYTAVDFSGSDLGFSREKKHFVKASGILGRILKYPKPLSLSLRKKK